ncbi:SpoIID/LytB domain protein [Nocardioides terrae]|uniref:SpoIID/LytB domain protein n=1 Tax=Nocardioides terrae TaxID=574651 RepID=A0A1I1GVG7_9ACTN|nr:SpoIID/LytB domain-containing protein [Nocardioides terrae]SFC15807.1 SpoIID/LytB domain protein [Nocardioides terrae]
MPLRPALRAAAAVGLGLATVLQLSATAPSYADTTVTLPVGATSVTVHGEGNGHGHGMSQYGANAAAKRGLSTNQILAHYYPGTAAGRAGGQVRVLLSTRPTLVVRTGPGLVAGVVGSAKRWRLTHLRKRAARKARRWSIAPLSPTVSRLSYLKRGHWRRYADVAGQLQFSAGGRPIRLVAGADSGLFRGTLRSAATSATTADRDIVNVVPLESYVKGVVPNEMPALWAPAAVRAQAIAARTYAVHERATVQRGWFDVYDTTASQVYRGAGSEQRASSRAVDATRGQIRTYAGQPAFTQFSASNGGWMLANSTAPYLVSGPDAYDPVNAWTQVIPMSAFQARFPSLFPLRSIAVTTYPGAGGWVQTVTLTGTNGKVGAISGEDFRAWAGLRSGSFRFTR